MVDCHLGMCVISAYMHLLAGDLRAMVLVIHSYWQQVTWAFMLAQALQPSSNAWDCKTVAGAATCAGSEHIVDAHGRLGDERRRALLRCLPRSRRGALLLQPARAQQRLQRDLRPRRRCLRMSTAVAPILVAGPLALCLLATTCTACVET